MPARRKPKGDNKEALPAPGDMLAQDFVTHCQKRHKRVHFRTYAFHEEDHRTNTEALDHTHAPFLSGSGAGIIEGTEGE